MRIPIGVKDDDRVSSLKIQAKTSSSCAEQEDKIFGIWSVETLEKISSLICFGSSVQSQVREASKVEVVLHNGHQIRHLTEEKDTMSRLFQFG